jgi:uncharacterized protein (DUF427 family)
MILIVNANGPNPSMKAIWNDTVVAESEDTIMVDGYHYFPLESLRREYFVPSATRSLCAWKGEASYYSLQVNGKTNPDAAWYYERPLPAAARVKGRVGFWNGVKVEGRR